jgi:hypothetical protein
MFVAWQLLVAGLLAPQSTVAAPQTPAPLLRPHEHVEVTDNRQTVRGRIADVTGDAVVLQRNGERVSLALAAIQRIDRIGDSLISGTAIGAAIGGGSTLALMVKLCSNTQCADTSANLDPRLTLLGTFIGAGIGALIDAAVQARKTVYRSGAGQPSRTVAQRKPAGPLRNGILIFGHAGGVRLSDDEGSLGGGATAGGGVMVPVGRRFGLQVRYDRHTRKREFESNRAFFGTEQVLTAKALYFLRPAETIRPYVGFGLALIDSKQRSVSPTFTLGPGNQVIPGPLETFHSHSRGSGAGFAVGLDARVAARISILGDLTLDLTDNRPEGLASTRLTVGAGWRF